MRYYFLFLLSLLAANLIAQEPEAPTLNIGDPAPPLFVRSWLKGSPVQGFEKGKIYVIELWATWCQPCKAAMPRLSVISRHYHDKINIIGIDLFDQEKVSLARVKAFVDSMSSQMDYRVAAADSNLITTKWQGAAGAEGIPSTFVIDAEGRLAWFGHPKNLDTILSKILNNTWNLEEALADKNMARRINYLDKEINYDMANYAPGALGRNDPGRPDSALLFIEDRVKKEPNLKYAAFNGFNTMILLMNKDQAKALEFGKMAMTNLKYNQFPYDLISDAVVSTSHEIKLSTDLYVFGAEALQAQIDAIPYPELMNPSKLYTEMAGLYCLADDRVKAVESLQKAIEAIKRRKDFRKADLLNLELKMAQYKN